MAQVDTQLQASGLKTSGFFAMEKKLTKVKNETKTVTMMKMKKLTKLAQTIQ
jgi:hypothetical protein